MIEIEAPDGSIVEFPEGTSDETITETMRREYPPRSIGQQATDLAGQIGQATLDVSNAIGTGLTGGWWDEIAAGIESNIPGLSDATFEENRAARVAQQQRMNPVARGLSEFGGAMVTGFASPMAVPQQLAARIPQAAQMIGGGAALGAVSGAGSAEPGERLEGAVTGAALGGATGGATAAALRGVDALREFVRNVARQRFHPEQAAATKILRAFERDDTTPQRVAARLRQLGPEATLADAAGENVLGLGRAAAGVPGPAKNRAAQVLTQRARGEAGRIAQRIDEGLTPTDYFSTADDLATGLRRNAQRLYQEAYDEPPLDSPRLRELFQRPIAQDALKGARRLADIEGGPVIPTDAPEGLPTEVLDTVKRSLDDMIANTRGNERRLLRQYKNEILEEADKLNPKYPIARNQFAGEMETMEALEEGTKALRQDPEVIRRTMADLSEGSQEAYRSGAAKALKDVIDKTGDTISAARKLESNSMMRQRLRAIFPDQKSYNEMRRQLLSELEFTRTRNVVLGGSPTAPRLAEQADLGVGMDIAEAATRGPDLPMMARFLGRAMAPNPQISDELSRALFTANPAANQRMVAGLAQSQNVAAQDAARRRILMNALSRAAAIQAAGNN